MILGVGNLLLRDEGVGVHVAVNLQEFPLPDRMEVIEGGTDGFKLFHLIMEADRLIVVDCVKGGDEPGSIYRFDIEEGWEFSWPLRTGHLFQNENSRGVLADTGSHLFDLLLWILGTQQAQVMSYEDDNRGGIEANALIDLVVEGSSQKSRGRIELSFTRRLRNTMKFFGERGCLEAETVGANEVFFYPPGQSDDPLLLRPKTRNLVKRTRYLVFSFPISLFR